MPLQKIRSQPDTVLRAVKAALMGNRFLKENKSQFVKLLAKETGVHDPVVAGLIHAEILKFSMDELIANSKEILKTSREVSFPDIADSSFARKAAAELPASPQ
jgi:hypothetical protein